MHLLGDFSKPRITLPSQYDIIHCRWKGVIVFHEYKYVRKYVSSLWSLACQSWLDFSFYFLFWSWGRCIEQSFIRYCLCVCVFFMVLFSFCLPISFFFYVLQMVLALRPFHAINFEIRVHISHSSDSKIYEDEHDIWTVFIQVEWDFFLGLWIIWPSLVIDNEKLTCKDWLMSWYIDSGLFACLFVFTINLYKHGPVSFH